MNLHRRFIVQFFIQLILIFVLFSLVLITLWGILGYSIIQQEIARDLNKADDLYFSQRISIENDIVTFDEDLKQLVGLQKSWLMVLTEQGEVLGSYHAPSGTPARLEPGELAVMLMHNKSFTLDDWNWGEASADPHSYVLILGKRFSGEQIVDQVYPEVNWDTRELNIPVPILEKLQAEHGWVQLLDQTGQVIDQFGADEQPDLYTVDEWVELNENSAKSAAAYHHSPSGLILLAGLKEASLTPTLEQGVLQAASNRMLWLLIFLFVLLMSITFWYARKFGYPLMTMMTWIQNLGRGSYEQPLNERQQSVFTNREGKLKRKYKMYGDLIFTLTQLTEKLKQNESERKKLTKTREEWISGLSHDLKTPLSSISGYAQMMESDNYDWSKEETRDFSKTISEKSAYMMELLEDLTLTYRLNNQALPIAKEEININEFIRRTLIHFINDPANSRMTFTFHPYPDTELTAAIDPKWFQRVVDNLLANAVKHNAPGTEINVSISVLEQHLIIITIADNGEGMDSETLNKLFQRYYRGTHTRDSVNGTGLGMAIAKQLVQLHGGSIHVNSALQQGTTVKVFLPM